MVKPGTLSNDRSAPSSSSHGAMSSAVDDGADPSFRLAPMSPGVRARTLALLAVPLLCLFAVRGSAGGRAAATVAVIYATVWLFFRPYAFFLRPDGLSVHWPLRRQVIAYGAIQGVRLLADAESPRGVRIGAGGLGGTFGYIVGGGRSVVIYASRSTDMVEIARRDGLPICVTPEQPGAFMETLARRAAGAAHPRATARDA